MKLRLPAVSHEMKFIALHIDEVDSVMDGTTKVDGRTKWLTEKIYYRVEEDVFELLDALKAELRESLRRSLRIDQWHKSVHNWTIWSDLHLGVRGRRSRSPAYVGIHVGQGRDEGFRLFAYAKLRRGGADAQAKFRDGIRTKLDGIHLASDKPDRFSGWRDELIWYDQILKPSMLYDDLETDFRDRTKAFFRIAKPLLVKASGL